MPDKRVFLTSDHALKSSKKYDWANNIAEGTHVQLRFAIYEDPNDTSKGWTAFETVISNEDLFALLKDQLEQVT